MPLVKARLAQLMVLTKHAQLLVQSCCLLMQEPRCRLCLHVWQKAQHSSVTDLGRTSVAAARRCGWWSRLQALEVIAAFAAGRLACRATMHRLQGCVSAAFSDRLKEAHAAAPGCKAPK